MAKTDDCNTRAKVYSKPVLVAILLLALALRLAHLDWGAPGGEHRWSYHPDEANLFLGLRAFHPTFHPTFHPYDLAWGGSFYLLYGAHTAVGGVLGLYPLRGGEVAFRDHPDALRRLYLWNRLLTVLLSAATVYAVARLSARIGLSCRVGLAAALLLAVAPWPVHHARFITAHTLTALLLVLSLDAIAEPGRALRAGFLLAATAGSECSMGFLWPMALGFVALRRRDEIRAFLCGGLLALPLFHSILLDPIGWREALRSQRGFIRPFGLDPIGLLGVLGPAISYTALAAGAVGLSLGARRAPMPASVAVLLFLVLALLGNPFARRFAPLYPILALGAGMLVERLPRRFGLALLTALLVEPALRTTSMIETMGAGDTRTAATEWAEGHLASGTSIAVQNWFFAPHLSVTRYRIRPYTAAVLSETGTVILTTERNDPSPEVLSPAGWVEEARFAHPHRFFSDRAWPEDLRYTNPEIFFFRKPS